MSQPKPNFFIIGAPKCGTTALSEYLRWHPRIFISEPKEPHFFAEDLWDYQRHYLKSWGTYLHLFKDAPDDALAIGEASVFYYFSDVALENIQAYDPNARIIMMVRNPVDMVYSLHAQYVHNGFFYENESDFKKSWYLQEERRQGRSLPQLMKNISDRSAELLQYAQLGRLGGRLEHIYKVFPKERIKIILFDDFINDTKDIYEDVLAFMHVPSDGRTVFPLVNPNQVRKYSKVRDIAKVASSNPTLIQAWRKVKGVFGVKRTHFIRHIDGRTTVEQKREALDTEFYTEVLATFEDDIYKLGESLDRDLSHWLSPRYLSAS